MIKEGEIYYTHTFPHGCKDLSFKYGGSDVCNSCGNSGLGKSWWNIKVMKAVKLASGKDLPPPIKNPPPD